MMTKVIGYLTAHKDRSCATSISPHVRRSNDKYLQRGESSLMCKRRVVALLVIVG
ncbi:hypothetical protein K443DRAFT_105638 [Laccaria amethystina LaAM-08-1]|uniref:Unplaced genomic scaffold K443scaffold_157, whole genome shotgun sequence n=1 Tax=Laccaria amethystina LaAM-08-1 TaxID=1095629 RepID=A0A0C9X809_9AGAR|nr:hypothetical protein K443DRAFT_105638 [Laccaria amethystina LaAM-08-1]